MLGAELRYESLCPQVSNCLSVTVTGVNILYQKIFIAKFFFFSSYVVFISFVFSSLSFSLLSMIHTSFNTNVSLLKGRVHELIAVESCCWNNLIVLQWWYIFYLPCSYIHFCIMINDNYLNRSPPPDLLDGENVYYFCYLTEASKLGGGESGENRSY